MSMTEPHAVLLIANGLEEAELPDQYRQPTADVFHVCVENLGIDSARYLVTVASTRPVDGGNKVVVAVFQKATVEAQNALLKLLEEPPAEVLFYVVVPHPSVLLSTLKSRLVALGGNKSTIQLSAETQKFLKATLAERLAVIADKQKAKDGEWMSSLVHELANWAAAAPRELSAEALISIHTAERYVNIRGSSRKSLLEDIALAL